MKILFVVGTRPEIIKMAPVIFEAQKNNLDFMIVHSGQHYDPVMDSQFFDELELPKPHIQLAAGGKPYAEQVAYLIQNFYSVFVEAHARIVVVQGDTVTVMCAALAAHRAGIPVAHIESGLRSRDPRMSEEYHRIITDHLSSVLCAPTEDAYKNLRLEGAPAHTIFLTGNTIVDAVRYFVGRAVEQSTILSRLTVVPKNYFVLTLHRAENVDEPSRFFTALQSITCITEEYPDREILFPVHPRVATRCIEFGATWPRGVRPITPLGYLDMLQLVAHAELILTDSGGLQEEASILGIPCVTLRDSTERPETIAAGMNVVAGIRPETVVPAVAAMRDKVFTPASLYGDGFAARRIIQRIRAFVVAHEAADV